MFLREYKRENLSACFYVDKKEQKYCLSEVVGDQMYAQLGSSRPKAGQRG